ncbi:MAG: DUF3137 domain-containing protein [Roseivirga sp.]|nr:DUF3137 domain-containing protein [Roseivirga sp.]
MKSQDEFRNLYHSDIEPLLRKMEVHRKRALASIGIVLLTLIIIFNSGSVGSGIKLIFLLVAVGAGAFGLVTYNEYKRDFKYKIMGRVVKLINPDYQFFDHRHFKLNTVLRSGLYFDEPDVIDGDDFVSGKINGKGFEFCELNFAQTRRAVRSDFKGLFIKMDFDRLPKSDITLFPDWHAGLKNNDSRNFEKELGSMLSLPMEFKERFSVFCHDEQEGHQFIGPNMQKAILALQQNINKNIHLSFQEDYLYCAIAFERDLFEPVIWYGALNPAPVIECFNLFSIPEKIIHHLTLSEEQIEEDTAAFIQPQVEVEANNEPTEELTEAVLSEAPEEIMESTIDTAIDQSLNLSLLADQLAGLKEIESDYDLQTYLQALYRNILHYKGEPITQQLLVSLLSDSFSSEPLSMDDSWLMISRSPEIDKVYRETQDADDMGFFTKPEHSGWSDFEFTEEVLKFQIAELYKMEGSQLDNAMKHYGVASETGTPWYNFDPVTNLDSGIRQLIDQQYHVDAIDCSIIGLIFQHGRVNS